MAGGGGALLGAIGRILAVGLAVETTLNQRLRFGEHQ
jgi:hypothetical protein